MDTKNKKTRDLSQHYDRVVELHSQGNSYKYIGEVIGAPPASVGQIVYNLRKKGLITSRLRAKKWTQNRIDEVANLFEDNTIPEIANILGETESAISHIIYSNNLSRKRIQKKTWDKDRMDRLRRYIGEGMPYIEVANRLGVSLVSVNNILNINRDTIDTKLMESKKRLSQLNKKQYWLYTKLRANRVPYSDRFDIINGINLPDVCPILGIPIEYNSNDPHKQNNASVDRIIPGVMGGKYEKGNIWIISKYANTVKNHHTFADIADMKVYCASALEMKGGI